MKYYLTYKEVMGLNLIEKKENIIKKIRELNQNDVIKVLSMLNALSLEEKEKLKLDALNPICNINLEDYHFYDTSNILYTLKWVIAYGKSSNHSRKSSRYLLIEVILLVLKTADHMFDEKNSETPEEIYTKLVLFNREADFDRSLIRYKAIFENIARVEKTYNGKQYDIHTIFEEKYGYSMKQLVSVIFTTTHKILKGVTQAELHDYKNHCINLDVFFDKLSVNKDTARKIVEDLSITPEALKDLARKSLNNAFDNEYLITYPFLKVDNKVVIVSKEILNNTIYNGLFFKVLDCFEDRNSFFGYFGNLFEIYASTILREACISSKVGYEYIDEFKYGVEKNRLTFMCILEKVFLFLSLNQVGSKEILKLKEILIVWQVNLKSS